MIKSFYNCTVPRYRSNEKKINKTINMVFYAEYLLMAKLCDFYVRRFYKPCQKALNSEYREQKIIVSMTTIPSRIDSVPLTLKSVFNQTMMPDRVILWISDEASNKDYIQKLLEKEVANGLEIRYIKDVRVHTKYYYAVRENPNNIIITVDDDIMYPEDLIEELYKCHAKNSGCVIAARAHEITFDGDKIKPYRKWHMLAPGVDNDAKCLLATGVGGVLYPPDSFYEDWVKTELFLELANNQDDIWLKVMEILKGTKVVKLYKYTKEPFILGKTQKVALSSDNDRGGRNDIFMENCLKYYHLGADDFRNS